jgi:hypothetical protein
MWHVVDEKYIYKTKGKYLLTGTVKNSLNQLLCFWTLSTVLYLFTNTQRFEDWILSPSSGGTYSQELVCISGPSGDGD